MPQIVEPTEPDAQREIIRLALDEIASEVGTALREAYLDFPVFLTVPNSESHLQRWRVRSIRLTTTGHVHQRSSVAS